MALIRDGVISDGKINTMGIIGGKVTQYVFGTLKLPNNCSCEIVGLTLGCKKTFLGKEIKVDTRQIHNCARSFALTH